MPAVTSGEPGEQLSSQDTKLSEIQLRSVMTQWWVINILESEAHHGITFY